MFQRIFKSCFKSHKGKVASHYFFQLKHKTYSNRQLPKFNDTDRCSQGRYVINEVKRWIHQTQSINFKLNLNPFFLDIFLCYYDFSIISIWLIKSGWKSKFHIKWKFRNTSKILINESNSIIISLYLVLPLFVHFPVHITSWKFCSLRPLQGVH